MNDEIKEDTNCIIKAFEHTNITIIKEDVKTYLFRGTDIGKVLNIVNIRTTIQNFDEDERVVRKAYDPQGHLQDTIFLTSRGIYRLLYNSKKEIAKQFRKWVGDILDDLIFNQGKELKIQLEKYHLLLAEKDQLLIEQTQKYTKEKEQIWKNSFCNKYVVYLIIISEFLIKFGFTKDFDTRLSAHKTYYGKDIKIAFIIESKNNEMLETLFKNHEKIKSNIITQEFNGDNKVELIKLDKNLNLKNVINVLKDTNKVIDTIIETNILRKYNVNVLNCEEIQSQLPLNQEQPLYQPLQELELVKEKTKQMEIQLEMLKYQQPQIQVQENLQEQPEENLSEELQFHKWLNENVINELGNVLIWKEVMLKLMNRRIGSGVSSKFKKYFENWRKVKFPNVNSIYKLHRTPNGSLSGYINFKLI